MIYVLCPNSTSACGGIKILYRHVDALNANGMQAAILHTGRGFRCEWFENETRVADLSDTTINPSDILVLPETSEKDFVQRDRWSLNRHKRGVRQLTQLDNPRVIFNQNAYYTFKGHGFAATSIDMLYRQPNTLGVLSVSDDNKRYLELAFPELTIRRVRYGFDPNLFYFPSEPKKKQIAFMPRKNRQDVDQVINILRLRGTVSDFELIAIDGMPEQQVAQVMRKSMMFLSFGHPEGCAMPPSEAMACGCVVVGYHGRGASEYFHPEFCYPVELGHIVEFVEKTEQAVQLCRDKPVEFESKARTASQYIRKHYSPEIEEHDVVSVWTELLANLDTTAVAA